MPLSSGERDLISRASRRDPEAFAELYVRSYERVLRRVVSIVKDPVDAEDITSEAFLRAWDSISSFETRDVSIQAWFCTIAEHLALKYIARRRLSVEAEDVDLVASVSSNPAFLAERNAEMAILQSAIAQLPDEQREVISRRFLEELSYAELGNATGRPPGSLRVIQHRAIKALRTILMRQYEAAPLAKLGRR